MMYTNLSLKKCTCKRPCTSHVDLPFLNACNTDLEERCHSSVHPVQVTLVTDRIVSN